jgi:AraC family transcriptional regulator
MEESVFEHQNSLRIEPLHLGRAISRIAVLEADTRLFAVRSNPCARTLEVIGTAVAAWIPLRGAVQVHCAGLAIPLHPGWALVTGPEPGQRAVATPGSKWLVLVGCVESWQSLLDNLPLPDGKPLPAMHKVDRDLLRRIISLARCTGSTELEDRLREMAGELQGLQAPLYQIIERSPGRSFAARLQVFLRLQRVRRFMNAYCERELDIEALARVANYSPCHFLRTFKTMYGETPHAYLVRQRLRRADRLLRSGSLAATEVALATGFENRSAFSRSYRQHFGITANEVRRAGPRRWSRRAAG